MATINGIDTELITSMIPTGNTIGNQIANIAKEQSNNTNKQVTPIENSTPNQEIPEEVKEVFDTIKNPLGTATQIATEKAKETFDKLEEEKQEEHNEKGEQGQLTPKEQVIHDQQKLWQREDQIRKETQEREDNAFQRMISDMRKAGINPNLINISGNGASSGGGITSATPKENIQGTIISTAMQEALKEIENAFEKGENTKDRITDIFNTLERTIGSIITLSFLKG